jgi:CRP-like cAMP-binding protein
MQTGPLEDLELFAGLSAADLAALTAIAIPVEFSAGDVVVADGDDNDRLHVILGGTAAVLYPGPTAPGTGVIELEAGAVVGEMSFIDGAPAWHTVRAQTRLRTLCFSHAGLRALLAEQPALAAQFMWRLAQILCQRLRATERMYHLERHIAQVLPGRAD